MAYRSSRYGRRSAPKRRSTYRRVRRSRSGSGRRPVRRATRRVSSRRRKSTARGGRITIVVQHQPSQPTLATPAAKAAPVRARFSA